MPAPTSIAWSDWDPDTFARARAENRPILLHIGATWCHWCHVMDEDSYTDPRVIQVLHDRYVCVRIDTDDRPDLNERYNQGGWPTIAVLDPATGEVLVGRTYVPSTEFYLLLLSCADPRGRWSVSPSRPEPPGAPIPLAQIRRTISRAYDPYHGGFGDLEKFPFPAVLDYLIDRAARGEPVPELIPSLDAIATKGLVDPIEGGFYRYCTQDDWSVPHYEKMLEDNARIVSVLMRAAGLPGHHPSWRAAADSALRWAIETLWQDEPGAFGGSQDADEGYHHRAPVAGRRPGPAPAVDPRIYAGWNGWMIEALLRGAAQAAVSGAPRPGLRGLARLTGARLLTQLQPDGAVRRLLPGSTAGLLEDQVGFGAGMLWLYASDGDARWLEAAERSAGYTLTALAATGGPGFRDQGFDTLGRMGLERRPLPLNAGFGELCWRLAALTGDTRWTDGAMRAWEGAMAEAERYDLMAAPAAALGERLLSSPVVVKVAMAEGQAASAVTNNPASSGGSAVDPRRMLDAALALVHPNTIVLRVAPGEVPAGHAMACSPHACARPVADPVRLATDVAALAGSVRDTTPV